MTRSLHVELGAAIPAAIWLLLAAAAGSFAAHFFLLWLVPTSYPSPWVMMPVFLLPLASAAATYNELSKVVEVLGLSQRERMRIKITVKAKQKIIMGWVCIILVAAFLCILGFFLISAGHEFSHWIFVAAVGLIAFSLAMIPFLLLQNKEMADFKVLIFERSQRKKSLNAALKRLAGSADSSR